MSTATARKIAATTGTRVAQLALGAVTGIVLARVLQPQGRGTFAVAVTVATTVLALGHLSVEQAHVALWRRGRAAIPANSMLIGPAAGLTAALLAGGLLVAVGPRAGGLPGHGLLAVALAAVPFGTTALYLNGVLVLQGRLGVVNRGVLLSAVVQCGGLLALAAAGRLTVASVVVVWTLSTACPLAVVLPALRHGLGRPDPALLGRTLLVGLRYHGAYTALFLLLRLDILILNALAGPVAVGLYTLAVTLAELSKVVTDATAQAVLADQAVGDVGDAVRVTVRATRASMLLALGAVGAMCLAAPVAVPLLYGHAFAGSVPAVLALAPGLVAWGATRSVGVYLVRLNRPVLTCAIAGAALLVNVVLNLLLIPVWGVVGCALSCSVGYAGMAVLNLWWFARATGTPLSALLPVGRRRTGGPPPAPQPEAEPNTQMLIP